MFRRAWHSSTRKPRFRILTWLYWSPLVLSIPQFYVPHLITGRSMQPTLNPDSSPWRDIGLFDRYSIRTQRSYNRDDIVALRAPGNPNRMLIKRIIGVEGDVVLTLPPYADPIIRVPPGHLWVEGDEPFHSDDSNLMGPVSASLVESKLIFILWPFHRFGPPLRPDPSLAKSKSAYQQAVTLFQKELDRKSRVNPAPGQGENR